MANREFLMLAQNFEGESFEPFKDWYVSEKLDGMRAFWDGGISAGDKIFNIPWANTGKRSNDVSTGLWSRYGNVIHAPSWWTTQLPQQFLDGELYLGRGRFQETISIVRSHYGDWKNVKFYVFDIPKPDVVFSTGQIKNPQFERFIKNNECSQYFKDKDESFHSYFFGPSFLPNQLIDILPMLKTDIIHDIGMHPVSDLDKGTGKAPVPLLKYVSDIVSNGGEGVILRSPLCCWTPYRTSRLLKVKDVLIGEGRCIGVNPGLGKYRGVVGSLIVEWNNNNKKLQFSISGLNDSERSQNQSWVGKKITFRYLGTLDSGVPRHAQFIR